jgi:hypothetical protein
MNVNQALEKAVLGFRVRHDGMQKGSYIYYEFDGWRIQFTNDGRKGSSSGWWADESDKRDDWYVIGENIDAWPDFVQTNWNVEAAVDEIVEEEPISIIKGEAWPSLK